MTLPTPDTAGGGVDSPGYSIYAVRKLLDAARCAELIEQVEAEAEWYEHVVDDPNGRVRQAIHDLDLTHSDLYDSVLDLALTVNEECWGFRLDGWQQPLRVARYRPGFVHDWHVDHTVDDASKLAMSLPLNEGYEGGELELLEVPPVTVPGPGHAIFFPAYHGHRVTSVRSGVRYVLLGWLTGPRFQ